MDQRNFLRKTGAGFMALSMNIKSDISVNI